MDLHGFSHAFQANFDGFKLLWEALRVETSRFCGVSWCFFKAFTPGSHRGGPSGTWAVPAAESLQRDQLAQGEVLGTSCGAWDSGPFAPLLWLLKLSNA